MTRGVVWLLGALALSALLILALNGICSRPLMLPTLSGYFCPRPLPESMTAPLNPASGEAARRKK